MKESELLRLVMDWLAAKHILAFRMNTGAIKVDRRIVRFGVPGMADILAFPRHSGILAPTWIELKVGHNEQSKLQRSFQDHIHEHGHSYILARSLEDVKKVMG